MLPDPSFSAKNQTASFSPEEIFLSAIGNVSSIPEDKKWCPVRALKGYIKKTKTIVTTCFCFHAAHTHRPQRTPCLDGFVTQSCHMQTKISRYGHMRSGVTFQSLVRQSAA